MQNNLLKYTFFDLKFVLLEASSSGPVMEMGNLFKPAAFQKFANVDDSTTTYYLKEDATTFHKIFLSTATTITFTAGDASF